MIDSNIASRIQQNEGSELDFTDRVAQSVVKLVECRTRLSSATLIEGAVLLDKIVGPVLLEKLELNNTKTEVKIYFAEICILRRMCRV